MAMKLFKNPAAKHYFKAGLKKNRKFFTICLILHMISFPLAFITLALDAATGGEVDALDMLFPALLILSFVFTAFAILLGVLISVQSFSYLHKKQETDTYMSLPLSDKQRFFSDYFSGLLSYMVPVLISGVATFITLAIAYATIKANPDSGYTMNSVIYGDHTINIFEIVGIVYLLVSMAMVMFYTLISLSCTLCGSLFETTVNSFVLNGAIPGMIALVGFIMFNRVPGVVSGMVTLPLIAKTSPIGAAIAYVAYADSMGEAVLLFPFVIKFWLWLFVFTLVYLAIAFFAYKKRKAEDVAKPYVFRIFYYIIIYCTTFAVCSIIPIAFDVLIIPMIIFAAVVFLAFEVITNRGFKKFGRSIIKCAVTIAASILLIGILDNGWCFGVGRRVPDADDVESVIIDNVDEIIGTNVYNMEIFDEDVIKAVISAHEKAADRVCDKISYPGLFKDYFDRYYYSYDEYYVGGSDKYTYPVTITYNLRNGSSMTREYRFNDEERIIMAQKLFSSKDYAKSEADSFMRSYRYSATDEDNTINISDMFGKTEYYIGTKSSYHLLDVELLPEEYTSLINDIAQAIEKDILDRTYEQVIAPYGYCGDVGSFSFYEYDENILATLREHNFPMPTNSEQIASITVNPIERMEMSYPRFESVYFHRQFESEEQKKFVKQLLAVASPHKSENSNYSVSVLQYYSSGYDVKLYVPAEYDVIARRLFNTGNETDAVYSSHY